MKSPTISPLLLRGHTRLSGKGWATGLAPARRSDLFRTKATRATPPKFSAQEIGAADDRLGLIMRGKRYISPKWRSFDEARAFVRSKGLTNGAEWLRFCGSGGKPDDIPLILTEHTRPSGEGWATGLAPVPSRHKIVSFDRSKRHGLSSAARGLRIRLSGRRFCCSGGKPDDIPATPEVVYKAEWRGMGDWLGTGAVAPKDRQFQSFQRRGLSSAARANESS